MVALIASIKITFDAFFKKLMVSIATKSSKNHGNQKGTFSCYPIDKIKNKKGFEIIFIKLLTLERLLYFAITYLFMYLGVSIVSDVLFITKYIMTKNHFRIMLVNNTCRA